MVRVIFPNLYVNGVKSVSYGDILVRRSKVNANCVIIAARKPVEFLFNVMSEKGIDTSGVDKLSIRSNTDGTLSVWDN